MSNITPHLTTRPLSDPERRIRETIAAVSLASKVKQHTRSDIIADIESLMVNPHFYSENLARLTAGRKSEPSIDTWSAVHALLERFIIVDQGDPHTGQRTGGRR